MLSPHCEAESYIYPTNGQHGGENAVLYKVPPWSEGYLSLGSLEDLLLDTATMKHQDSNPMGGSSPTVSIVASHLLSTEARNLSNSQAFTASQN